MKKCGRTKESIKRLLFDKRILNKIEEDVLWNQSSKYNDDGPIAYNVFTF